MSECIRFGEDFEVCQWIDTLIEPGLEVQALGSSDSLFFFASEVEALVAALEVRLRELKGEEA